MGFFIVQVAVSGVTLSLVQNIRIHLKNFQCEFEEKKIFYKEYEFKGKEITSSYNIPFVPTLLTYVVIMYGHYRRIWY